MAQRNYPNDNFAWYNDEDRFAILTIDDSSTSGERTSEKYDTFQGTGDLSGNITATSTAGGSSVVITSAAHGLAVGDRIAVSGTTTYDGNYAVTAIDGGEFTISATNSTSNEGAASGVIWTSLFVEDGIRLTFHAKYETIDAVTDDLKTDGKLDSGLHPMVVCYIKARIFEDSGDVQKSQYFRQMYEKQMKQYPLRKSGVRQLAVPYM